MVILQAFAQFEHAVVGEIRLDASQLSLLLSVWRRSVVRKSAKALGTRSGSTIVPANERAWCIALPRWYYADFIQIHFFHELPYLFWMRCMSKYGPFGTK